MASQMDRRAFIRQSASLVGAGLLLPSAAARRGSGPFRWVVRA